MRIIDYASIIRGQIDAQRLYKHTEEISRFHRIQMSEGYHAAAKYCIHALEASNINCRLLDIPLPKGTRSLGQRGFDAWDCISAVLKLRDQHDAVLCDYTQDPLSVIQRSFPVNIRNAEIIMLNPKQALNQEQIFGKLVFIHAAPWETIGKDALAQGALGIITDHIVEGYARKREDVYDARGLFNFYWHGDEDEIPGFGFVLTPRQGDALAQLCLQLEKEGRRPHCDANIEARSSPGHMEIVEARIPGLEEGEIIVTAHLCHGMPSANDNASGCAGAIELMSVLSNLINSGHIARPKFGITMVLAAEASGTFAYLDAEKERLPNFKAAINLDMIGRRQEGRSGMLGIIGPCDALPSFIIDFMAYIRRITDCEAPTFNIDEFVSPFHSQILEFAGGSDHVIYGDPAIGVPSITLMQWMDKDYHTNKDTIENIDPEMLEKSTAMAAIWAYGLANLKQADLPPIIALTRERFLEQLHRQAEKLPCSDANIAQTYEYILDVFYRALEDIRQFTEDADSLIEGNKRLILTLKEEVQKQVTDCSAKVHSSTQPDLRIPVRNLNSPLSFVGEPLGINASKELAQLKASYPGLYGYNSVDHFILFRIDGKRSVDEIARSVGFESRFNEPGYVSRYIDWLCTHGVAKIRYSN